VSVGYVANKIGTFQIVPPPVAETFPILPSALQQRPRRQSEQRKPRF